MESGKDLKGKKLLILGGMELHSELVKTARRLGVETYVTDYLPHDKAPAKQIADHAWDLDVNDVDAIVERCRVEKIDGVINIYYNSCQLPHQAICERLGLPCFGTKEHYEIFTDKKRFLETCVQYGVDIIPQYREEDFAFDDPAIEYPVYVKPSDSRGSRGQSVCRSYAEVADAIARARSESLNGSVIIERYMENAQDIQLALVVADGEPYLEESSDMYNAYNADGCAMAYSLAICPSVHEDFLIEQLHKKLGEMLKALNIQNAPIFLQGFLDHGKLRFYDPALRFPANVYEKMLRDKFGLDIFEAMIVFALTGRFPGDMSALQRILTANGIVAGSLRTYVRPGTICEIRGLDELRKRKEIIYLRPVYKEGDRIEDWKDFRQSFALVGIVCQNMDQMKEVVTDYYDKLQVLDENGEDMKLMEFDTPWQAD